MIRFRRWSSWLGQFFRKLPEITKYQHFRFDGNLPGQIHVKQSVDSKEKAVTLLKQNAPSFGEQPPSVHGSKSLSAKRQWYLYEMIRPHIPSVADKDATVPKPKIHKPAEAKG